PDPLPNAVPMMSSYGGQWGRIGSMMKFASTPQVVNDDVKHSEDECGKDQDGDNDFGDDVHINR
ncbi:MAG: hypothetical protein ACWGQW_10685, partial [bacterium]